MEEDKDDIKQVMFDKEKASLQNDLKSVRYKKKDQRDQHIQQRDQHNIKQCYRCGSADHFADNKKYPAKNQKCSLCGRMGDFARVCKRSKRGNIKFIEEENDSDCQEDQDDENGVFCIEYDLLDIEQGLNKKPVCELSMGGIAVKVTVDSGSPFSIMEKKKDGKIHRNLWRHTR
ncbi:hypothetical protein NDU88_005104 [Pleurodeles waltl]|uniref:Uncharacterized protein n=1 Tax=Pleurodeles waltl TaxID=8319 RepID=A0AAV7TUE2_PLEWA|nr:hypothetical protein NDU88_005104 [Pleurodeles waltl]